MTDTRYKITMDGNLAPGVSLEHAQENFARLFKTDISAIKRLFSSGPTVIKRNISSVEADKYVQALLNAGVIAHKEVDLATALSLEPITNDAAQQTIESSERMSCPKCAAEQAKNDICQSCGIVFAKFHSYQAAQDQQSALAKTQLASPYATPKAIIEQDNHDVGELNYWGIEGRLGRMRYIAWSLVLMLAMTPAMLIGILVMQSSMLLGGLLLLVMGVAVTVVGIQFSIKRLHDIGWSGWLLLITLIPVVGSIFQLLVFILPGSQNSNRYGAPPPANSTAVKVLFWLWLLFLLSGFVLGLLTGMLSGTMH